MYAVAIILTFFGISLIIAYLGLKLKKSYPIMTAFFLFLSFYFIILGLGSLLLIINENVSGTNGEALTGLVETTYQILQLLFTWIVMPLFILGIIFDLLQWIYNTVNKKKLARLNRWNTK